MDFDQLALADLDLCSFQKIRIIRNNLHAQDKYGNGY